MTRQLKLAVLISGGGTTLKNLLEKNRLGEIDADFRLVISSNPNAGGLAFAKAADIPTAIVRRSSFSSASEHSQAVFDLCRKHQVDFVLMGGYLEHVLIPDDFTNRVLNTHPALIPSFCGKGFYGQRVHQAVLDYGVKISGCTIHFVDNQYDHGPVILQRAVEVKSTDTPEELAKRVFASECEAYPAALLLLADNRVRVEGRRVIVV